MNSFFATMQVAFVILANSDVFTSDTIPIEPGTYSVSVGYESGSRNVETIIQTTVGSENFITAGDVAIDASDIYVTSDQVLDREFLISESRVRAWNINNNESYQIEKIDVVELDDTTFEVSFTTINSVSTTINVFVVSKAELYETYIQDEEENLMKYYASNNYRGFLILSGLFILVALTVVFFLRAQYIAQKQFNEIMKL